MEQEKEKGKTLLARLTEGVERLELIYQSAIQDGGVSPFDRNEYPELWRLWQEFRRALELGNETRIAGALRQILESIQCGIRSTGSKAQNC